MHWIYAHLIGDYLLQTDWMAYNKKLKSWPCLVHTFCYMLPFLFTGLLWWQLALIAIQHFLQDRTNFVTWFLKIKGSGDFATGSAAPWSAIVTDNIFHILSIALISSLKL